MDGIVAEALGQGLSVIIDLHHYEALASSPVAERARFLGIWRQLAEHYASQPPEVMLELLNEPAGRITPALWNQLLNEAIAVIRESNPERTLVVDSTSWASYAAVPALELPPEDRRLLVTFHYYEPYRFTHQGAPWAPGSENWLGNTWDGDALEQAVVRAEMGIAAAWAAREGRPLWLGEFGTDEKVDMPSRVRWTSFVAREAEARGIPWCYWEFGTTFGIYEPWPGRWREDLLQALIPA